MNDIIDWLKSNMLVTILLGINIALVIGIVLFLLGNFRPTNDSNDIDKILATENQTEEVLQEIPSETANSSQGVAIAPAKIIVDVKGSVEKPGIYELPIDSRVQYAIDQAGGPSKAADLSRINLALTLNDQMVVYIPNKSEALPDMWEMASSNRENQNSTNQSSNQDSDLININTANQAELMTISGIGEKKAQDIIDYRDNQGAFTKIEDLTEVSGIGDKIFEKLKDQITIN